MPTINSEGATVLFAGLTPGLVGLDQVDFQIPADAPNGDLTIELSQNGIAGNTNGFVPVMQQPLADARGSVMKRFC